MAESVVVGVRVRPFNQREKDLNADVCIEMEGPRTGITDPKNQNNVPTNFAFDESFWSHDGFENDETGYSRACGGSNYADQNYVFETFGKRVLDNAWGGFHCCLFAYGQTGAGKSYSMVGYGTNKGIVPISCEEIFNRIAANPREDLRFEVVVSMIEIYNECVQDLLIDTDDRPKKGLDIRESKMLGIYVDGVSKRPTDSYAAIEKTIDEATENRTVGSTLMNATSSRAHTVVIIEFKQIESVCGKDTVKVSMINLVDLAGSEKAGQTGATGDRLKEGAAINKSLSALGNVIEKLAAKSQGGKKGVIIPYRDSKLTRLLQNALGGSSKTIMVCALSPASSNYEETLSTLRYADRAKKIKNNAVVNENPQEKLMRELKEENAKLQEFMEQMKTGFGVLDAQALNDKIAEIKAAEGVLKETEKGWDVRLAESKSQQEQSQGRRRQSCLTRGNVFAATQEVCHLANLNEDQQLTGRIKHRFPEGQVITLGKSPDGESSDEEDSDDEDDSDSDATEEPDVVLGGEGIFCKHATVKNVDGICYISSKGEAADNTFVNGISISVLMKTREEEQKRDRRQSRLLSIDDPEKIREALRASIAIKAKDDGAAESTSSQGIALEHGDRVAFGTSLFVYVDPLKGMAEVLIMSGEVSYTKARKELAKNQWKSAGLKFMKGMKLAKAMGAKDVTKQVLRRLSSAEGGEDGEEGALEDKGEPGSDSDESSVDHQAALDQAQVVIEEMKNQLDSRDHEIADLKRQLASKDAQLAAAHKEGGMGVRKSTEILGKSKEVRGEILTTFESAIDAIEQVESQIAARMAARSRSAPLT